MTKMERSQVLNVRKEAGPTFRDAPPSLNVQTPFDNAMETNSFRIPFLPLRASQQAHFNGSRLAFFKKSRYEGNVSFRNPQTKFFPTWTLRLEPLVGENDRH